MFLSFYSAYHLVWLFCWGFLMGTQNRKTKSIFFNLGSASSMYFTCQLAIQQIQNVTKLPLLMGDSHEIIAVPECHFHKWGIFTARHLSRKTNRENVSSNHLFSDGCTAQYRFLSQVYLFNICRQIHRQSVMYGKYVCKNIIMCR